MQFVRSPHGSQRVVPVEDRHPEDGHDRIPDELFDRPPVGLDDSPGHLEEAGEDPEHALGVEALAHRGRSGDVAEEGRHGLSLLGRRCSWCLRCAARRAEWCVDRYRPSARRALHPWKRQSPHERRARAVDAVPSRSADATGDVTPSCRNVTWGSANRKKGHPRRRARCHVRRHHEPEPRLDDLPSASAQSTEHRAEHRPAHRQGHDAVGCRPPDLCRRSRNARRGGVLQPRWLSM